MAARRRSSKAADQDLTVATELGRLSAILESMETARIEDRERAKEDRERVETSIVRLETSFDGLRHSADAMSQTLASTSNQVAKLAVDKCGERLDRVEASLFSPEMKTCLDRLEKVEGTVGTWRRWMGTGLWFIGRVALAIAASGIIAGTFSGIIQKIADKLM